MSGFVTAFGLGVEPAIAASNDAGEGVANVWTLLAKATGNGLELELHLADVIAGVTRFPVSANKYAGRIVLASKSTLVSGWIGLVLRSRPAGNGKRLGDVVMRRIIAILAGVATLCVAAGCVWLWNYSGPIGFNDILRRGGTYWITVPADDRRLSPAMRLALKQPAPEVQSGELIWREIEPGFEVADLSVLYQGREVDRIFLNRIDPKRFRFVVRNAAAGDRGIDQWEQALPQAVLIVNGSYFGPKGLPATPFLSNGAQMGPANYDARAGAFVAADGRADIADLTNLGWRSAFKGTTNAMVSFPLLIGADGETHVATKSRWLANRTFVGKDGKGLIVVGTTREAFFPLDRLATFLKSSPLGLSTTLNLDGGPIACQSVRLNGFHRKFYANWEAQANGNEVRLLRWPFAGATWAMPIVLTAERR